VSYDSLSHSRLEVCGNTINTPIPSHSHLLIPILIPVYSYFLLPFHLHSATSSPSLSNHSRKTTKASKTAQCYNSNAMQVLRQYASYKVQTSMFHRTVKSLKIVTKKQQIFQRASQQARSPLLQHPACDTEKFRLRQTLLGCTELC